MNMEKNLIRCLIVGLAVLLSCGTMQAQFGKRLGKAVEDAAKNATIRKAQQKTDEAVSKTIDKATNPDTYKGDGKQEGTTDNNNNNSNNSDAQPATQQSSSSSQTDSAPAAQAIDTPKALETAYAKSDFVPGDEIVFSDDLANEQLGEFPSQWDLLGGSAEVATYNGVKSIHFEVPTDATIAPLMKDMKNYLPEVFTLEFDFWVNAGTEPDQQYILRLFDEEGRQAAELTFAADNGVNKGRMSWNYSTPSDESRSGSFNDVAQKGGEFNHLSVSFNKRALKVYVNGIRVVNVPNMKAPKNFAIRQYAWGGFSGNKNAITNIRLAQGAVPLYDRMMNDGKFITYGITFDVGKSTIKPESMGEINRIVKLMTDNPDLKFSVEGHTDSSGNADSNQTLSEARSKAIVGKLVESGISADRLTSAGKGQNNPIADNGSDEGRAKNRRVEFVKI